MLKNPTYIGKIRIKAWKKEDECVVEGLHPAIIDETSFNKAQQRFRRKKVALVHKDSEIDEQLPLRGHLICRNCNRALTGSASRGGSGIRHFYYHCQPKCKERFKATEANQLFEEMLEELTIKEDVKTIYHQILKRSFQGGKSERELKKRALEKELNKLKERLDSIETKFFDDLIDVSTYNRMKEINEDKIVDIEYELDKIKEMTDQFDAYLKKGISMLNGIDKLYRTSPSHIKKKITTQLFPDMLIYTPNQFQAVRLDGVINLILESNLEQIKHLRIAG